MTETKMPATEAGTASFDERNSYEFAFHVLPTVAEGEVAGVFEEIKAHISTLGEIFDEEAPERTDLVYPIIKSTDGKNRKYTSAYFGWVRFKLNAEQVDVLMEELGAMSQILRHLLIKLTAIEEARPFRFHVYRKSVKMVETVQESDIIEEVLSEVEEDVVISEEDLEKSLDKITHADESK